MEEIYKDCMRNHAATLGTYATDGCGEYTPDAANPETMRCAACGCHRNFHRKVTSTPSTTEVIGFGGNTVVTGYMPTSEDDRHLYNKKRTRTKFSAEQKERMMEFAGKIGWKMPRKATGGEEVERFCREIGVSRQVFKIWMHNHKNESSSSGGGGGNVGDGSGGQPDSSTLRVESSPSYG